jgi:phosphohistidine phosphatase
MILYFLRHELAGDRAEWMADDRKRPLTEEGKRRMAGSARALAGLGLGLEAIVTSPLTRARQTAEIAAEGLGMQTKLIEDERLAPGFDTSALAGI